MGYAKETRGLGIMMKILQTTILALLLAMFSGMSWAAQTVTYYHLDALGSPIAATNEQGNVVWREAYEPYGNRIRREAASSSNKTWYTGKQEDVGVGLSYFGARWYDPVVGRFMGIDPVGFKESNLHSFGRYTYANNNPYKFVDPDGREALPGISRDMAGLQGRNLQAFDARHKQFGKATLGVLAGVATGTVAIQVVGRTAAAILMAGSTAEMPVGITPKLGSAGGPGAGKNFPKSIQDAARQESGNTCVFCGTITKRTPGPDPQRSHIDHAIPKSRGGNNTIDNAQNTCQTCNLDKRAQTTQEYLKHLQNR